MRAPAQPFCPKRKEEETGGSIALSLQQDAKKGKEVEEEKMEELVTEDAIESQQRRNPLQAEEETSAMEEIEGRMSVEEGGKEDEEEKEKVISVEEKEEGDETKGSEANTAGLAPPLSVGTGVCERGTVSTTEDINLRGQKEVKKEEGEKSEGAARSGENNALAEQPRDITSNEEEDTSAREDKKKNEGVEQEQDEAPEYWDEQDEARRLQRKAQEQQQQNEKELHQPQEENLYGFTNNHPRCKNCRALARPAYVFLLPALYG